MCVDKNEFSEWKDKINGNVKDLLHDTKNIRNGLKGIQEQLRTLNGRTATSERRLDNVEDQEYREVRCIQREVINIIHQNMLTVDKFEEWEQKKQEEKEKQEEKLERELEIKLKKDSITVHKLDARQRRNGWITTAIVGAGTIAMALIGYLS